MLGSHEQLQAQQPRHGGWGQVPDSKGIYHGGCACVAGYGIRRVGSFICLCGAGQEVIDFGIGLASC